MAFTGDYLRVAPIELSLLGCDSLITCSPLVRLGDKGETVIRVKIHNAPDYLDLNDVGISFEANAGGKLIQDENKERFRVIDKTTFEYLCADEIHSFIGTINVAYFVLRRTEKRVTTQNFTIHSLVNAEQNTDGLKEHYVSVIDDLIESNKNALEEASKIEDMINKNQVVKKTGDTMTGNLAMDQGVKDSVMSLRFHELGIPQLSFGLNRGKGIYYDQVNNTTIFGYDPTTKELTFNASTNTVKKAGDTMTGDLNLDVTNGTRAVRSYKDGVRQQGLYFDNNGDFGMYDWANTQGVLKYFAGAKRLDLLVPNTNIAMKSEAQIGKITTDIGGQTISASATSDDILQMIIDKGRGFHTIYCSGVVTNSVPSKASWRGHAFHNSAGFGYVLAKDYKGNLYSNYMDNGNWLGWVLHVGSDAVQMGKIIQDDGFAFPCHGLNADNLLQPQKYFGNNIVNSPDGTGAYFLIETFKVANATSFIQHATRWSSPQLYYRTKVNTGGWSAWEEVVDRGSVIQKAGDTMNGNLVFSGSFVPETSGSGIVQGGGSSTTRWRMYQSGGGELSFVPSATAGGSDWDWGKAFRIKSDGTSVTPKDTTQNLTISSDFTPTSGSVQNAVRRGNTVTLMLDVTRNADSTNPIMTTLPEGLRPIGSLTTDIMSTDGTMSRLLIRFNGEVHLDTKGKRYRILQTFVTP
ncbi:BppU family phage baseplate upper protein [Bacillus cereus]|uniref:BppU family phage baseplate upper protein n=1 Tax=Bacillus cereus TaxID=1396 RepID=UPI00119E43DE|nr:BppU family phage baseplate upper protein [Bacillus cereus]